MNTEKICCPRFDPALWDGKTLEWGSKKLIKGRVCTLFYMPLNFGGVMKRMYEKMEKAGAVVQDGMWLSDHTSKWNMDLYVAVDKEVAGVENVVLSGKYFFKVYEGNFKDTGMWMKDFESYIKEKGLVAKTTFMWYTTCPKCAKKYGKNYVVLVGRIG